MYLSDRPYASEAKVSEPLGEGCERAIASGNCDVLTRRRVAMLRRRSSEVRSEPIIPLYVKAEQKIEFVEHIRHFYVFLLIFLSRPAGYRRGKIKCRTMPPKNNFRYKKGHTEIESDNDNKGAIRLAYLNTILSWILRLVAVIVLHKILSG